MGRSGPPGRRGTRRDAGSNVNLQGASAAPHVLFGPSGGPLRPTEGRGLLPLRRPLRVHGAGALWCPTPRRHPLLASEQETAVKGVIIIEIWY